MESGNGTSVEVSPMTDEEYRWEPVPGCWSVRRRGQAGTASGQDGQETPVQHLLPRCGVDPGAQAHQPAGAQRLGGFDLDAAVQGVSLVHRGQVVSS